MRWVLLFIFSILILPCFTLSEPSIEDKMIRETILSCINCLHNESYTLFDTTNNFNYVFFFYMNKAQYRREELHDKHLFSKN